VTRFRAATHFGYGERGKAFVARTTAVYRSKVSFIILFIFASVADINKKRHIGQNGQQINRKMASIRQYQTVIIIVRAAKCVCLVFINVLVVKKG